MKIIEISLAAIIISAAVYYFDSHDFNSWLVSIVLLLGAVEVVLPKGVVKDLTRKIRLPLLIFMVVKVLLYR